MSAPLGTGRWPDVPTYIYGITREIWEERGVGESLARYYAGDCRVRAPSGLTTSMAGVAADTLMTLHQFPDRQLVGEDVIWKPVGSNGAFLSSHRLISVMHHTGDGRWGRATGARVKSRIIADCLVDKGQVTEEWLVRDGAAFAHALGTNSRELSLRQYEADRAAGRPPAFFTPAMDVQSGYTPECPDDPAVALVTDGLQRMWEEKTPAVIRRLYAEGAAVHLPGGTVANGHGEIDRWLVSMLAFFPDARLRVRDATVLREAEWPVQVAVRFELEAHHVGWGRFGAPTGAPVHLMGLLHAHVSGGRILAEWLLFDEVAIWTQIFSHAPPAAGLP
ncbi:MAG: ester cyclase [Acetobacteraceae bacterium]|nr:ester cyclase [Acetobacteraceae bacterium]